MPRKPIDRKVSQVNAYLYPGDWELLLKLAEEEQCSSSEILRRALRHYGRARSDAKEKAEGTDGA